MARDQASVALRGLLEDEQKRHIQRVNELRFFGASAFFGLFVVLGVVFRLSAWEANLSLFFVYWGLAGAVLWFGRRPSRARRALGLAVAVVDMPVVYFLMLSMFPHSNPSGVAGFTVGIYVFLILLAALSLEPWALVLTAVVGIGFEGRLQTLAGVNPGAIVASAILLTLASVACGYGRRRLLDLVERLALIAREQKILRDLAQKTRDEAYTDSLTGLHNRLGFLTIGQQQLASAARTGLHYIVIFMDLDGLKVINDSLGHALGDDAIREAAKVLRATLRDADLVARVGGDEFVALAADSMEASRGGSRIIERISERLKVFNDGVPRAYRLQISAGASAFDPTRPRVLESLLAEADAAMYAQKKSRPSRTEARVITDSGRMLIEARASGTMVSGADASAPASIAPAPIAPASSDTAA